MRQPHKEVPGGSPLTCALGWSLGKFVPFVAGRILAILVWRW